MSFTEFDLADFVRRVLAEDMGSGGDVTSAATIDADARFSATMNCREPIVIAGLTVNARSRARSGVPLLSDLPVVGALFRVDEDAEHFQDLIIILTPRIEPDGITPNP